LANDSQLRLARRLRELRKELDLTQPQVARALRVSVPLISSWESEKAPELPPVDRLSAYATAFATEAAESGPRWRPGSVDNLSPTERNRQEQLTKELLGLRRAAQGTGAAPEADNPWRFPDGGDITIVCGKLSDQLRQTMPTWASTQPDYLRMYSLADLDSLVEVYGHIRATNPETTVKIKLPEEVVGADDYESHLVLLGGPDWNTTMEATLAALQVPITQKERPTEEDRGGFDIRDGIGVFHDSGKVAKRHDGNPWHFLPRHHSDGVLAEDVALFVRGPNPNRRERTVTICSGVNSQGTYGAVLALTDPEFRDRNAAYIESRGFPPAKTYSLLFRVEVGKMRLKAVTPNWQESRTVLHEWSEDPAWQPQN
jgi:transcriptional regulator with XRE-family HTH domain